MIICQNCETENPLGRVFCGNCGTKLETSGMGKTSVKGSQRSNFFIRHWILVVAVIALIPISMFVMSMTPAGKAVGTVGTLPGAKRVESNLATLAETPSGQTRGVTLTEAEINGYLEHYKRAGLHVESVSITLQDDWIRFRVLSRMFSLDVGPAHFAPLITYDFDCIPVGGQLRIRKVTKGKLSLGKGGSNRAVRKFLPKLTTKPDWEILSSLSEIDAQQGQVHLTVER